MKKTVKRIISLLLTTVMVFGAAPLSGFVGLKLPDISGLFAPKAVAATEGYYSYVVKNGNATITNVNASISGDILFPSSLGGYPVTNITCSIGNVTSIRVDDTNEHFSNDDYGVLFNKDKTNLIEYPSGNKRTTYTIPDTTTNIGCDAFCNSDHLVSIIIPDSVINIETQAFQDCDGLISLSIPDSVTSIGIETFDGCDSLTSIIISDGLTSISDGAFSSCKNLTNITFPNTLTSIGKEAFSYCRALTSITIPDGVTSIGEDAFSVCDNLTSVTLPQSITKIEFDAFDCPKLTDVYYNGNIATWCSIFFGGSCANPMEIADNFYINGSLLSEDLIIPDGVTSINSYVFMGFTNLTSITIPNSVTNIGETAFCSCVSLTSITIPDSVISIGETAFCSCVSLTSITIPDSVISIGSHAFYDTGYYNDENNWENNVLYIGKHLIEAKNTLTGTYEIKERTITIADSAFFKCLYLTSVISPYSLRQIGDRAFEQSNITNITIDKNTSNIGWCAFYSCYKLTDVYYGGNEKEWDSINISANNYSLVNATIHFNCMDASINTILDTFVENRSMWVEESVDGYGTQYGFFDFDNDGVLELVSSTYTGTGHVNFNSYYKFDSANGKIIKLTNTVIPDGTGSSYNIGFDYSLGTDKNPDYQEHPVCFYALEDRQSGEIFYFATDLIYAGRDGYLEEYGTIRYINGTIESKYLLGKYFDYKLNNWSDFWYYENGEEKGVSESEFNIRYNNFFKQYDKLSMTSLMSEEISTNMTDAELKETLLRLYNAFSYEADNSSSGFDEGINVFSSSGSTSIAQGESTRYAVCVYENGEQKNDVSNLAFINETPDIFTISRNNDVENGYCYITVKAKNCGVGFLQINDSSTGETARIIISVINPKANSYTIHNVPEFANHGEHTPNILYFNGLNIDDFKYEKQNNDGCIMDFNVFNTLPVYALVTVFDANGKSVSTQLINKHEQYAESLYSGLVDEPIKILKDTLSGDLFSYRQTGGYSTETNISVFVPSGGYIKITNNSTQSGVLELINFFDAFIKFKSLVTGALDLSKWKPVEFDCLQTAAEDLLKKTEDEHIKSFKSSVFMDCVKEVTFSPESLIDCANSISNCIESLDPELFDIIANNAIKVGVDIGEDFFTTFAGAAGAVLKGAFLYNTYWNIYENLYYIGATSNVGAISIRNPNESTDTMTYDDVTVINPNGFDSETSLSTYMVTFDEGLPEDFKNNVLNSDIIKNFCENRNISIEEFVENKELYQLHDITFIKNGKEYQPGSEVEVFLPVSEEMKSEASWWERLKVYRIEDDGTLTDMNAKYSSSNEMVSFKTNHFSLYLVLVEKGLSIAITPPSTTTITYGDTITLHAELNTELPEGASIKWSINNGNFKISYFSDDDLTCTITPQNSGDSVITVTVYDVEDNVICEDEQTMTAKAGFFQKIIAFFKKLFGLNKTIPQLIKKSL